MSYSLAKRSATSLRAADSNAVLAAQAFQNDPDLLLGRIVRARNPGMFYARMPRASRPEHPGS